MLVLCSLAVIAGCGKTAGAVNTEITAETAAEATAAIAAETTTTTAVTEGTDTAAEADNTIPEERNWDRIPTVMIDGVVHRRAVVVVMELMARDER